MSASLIALCCFAVAAIAGLTAAYHVLSDRMPPWGVTALHGLFGASGLALLAYAVLIGGAAGYTLYALVALLVAALGGFFLVSFHVRGLPHPKPVVVIHAGVAVLGVASLVLALI